MKRSVPLLMLTNLAAMAAGFLREIVLAQRFGTSGAADAFVVNLLAVEGISVVAMSGLAGYMLVPNMTRLIQNGRTGDEYALMQTLWLWLSVLCLPLVIFGTIRPDYFAELLGPGFPPAQSALLAEMVQICLPAVALILLAGVASGVLQARADYYSPVVGRALFSLSIAGFLFFGAIWFGVRAGAFGILAGAGGQLVMQIRALLKKGWRLSKFSWRHAALPGVVRFGGPVVLALLFSNVLMGSAQRFLASGLPEGSLAAVSFAHRSLSLITNVSLAIATVSMTELSHDFNAAGVGDRFAATLMKSLDTGILLLVPLSVWLWLASGPIASILFERGEFGASSVLLTGRCLKWYSATVVPGMALGIFMRSYPALWRPWGATRISAVWAVATVGATAALLPWLKAAALPAGSVAGTAVACVAGALGLRNVTGNSFLFGRLLYFCRISVLALAALVPLALLSPVTPAQPIPALLQTTVLFGAAFLLVCAAAGENTVCALWRSSWRFVGQSLSGCRCSSARNVLFRQIAETLVKARLRTRLNAAGQRSGFLDPHQGPRQDILR